MMISKFAWRLFCGYIAMTAAHAFVLNASFPNVELIEFINVAKDFVWWMHVIAEFLNHFGPHNSQR